jgi:hypothetical protein
MLAARQDMLTDTEIAARRAQEDNESPQAPSLADLTPDDL